MHGVVFFRGPCTKTGVKRARGMDFTWAVHENGPKTCTGPGVNCESLKNIIFAAEVLETEMVTNIKTFRELSTEEFFRICEVREEVFVLEQKITLCAELDQQDLYSTHITISDGSRIVAYARCYAEDGSAHIGRVLTTVRGKGYGQEVMTAAIAHCREAFGCNHIVVHAQVQVIGFYEKLGFHVTSDLYDECGIMHRTMELG